MPAASCRGSEEVSWLLVLLVVRQSPGPLLSGPLLGVRAIVVPYICLPKYSKSCWCGYQPTSTRISSQARSTSRRARRCRCGVVWATKGRPPQLVVVVVVVVVSLWGRVGDHRSPSTARVVGSSSRRCLPKKKHRASTRCGRRGGLRRLSLPMQCLRSLLSGLRRCPASVIVSWWCPPKAKHTGFRPSALSLYTISALSLHTT